MNIEENNRWVEEVLKDRHVALIGFADLSEVDPAVRHNLPYAICFAIRVEVMPSLTDIPSMEFHDFYYYSNRYLAQLSYILTDAIKERGYNARPVGGDGFDKASESTPLPYRTLATRAGLGWIGKSANLVTKEYGPAVRISGVLTDMPVKTGTPINSSQCGNCTACTTHCPGHAISGKLWDVNSAREDFYDFKACNNAIAERGKAIGVTNGTCGICVGVCPHTKKTWTQPEPHERIPILPADPNNPHIPLLK
jgi:epoxyqueuosine reductase